MSLRIDHHEVDANLTEEQMLAEVRLYAREGWCNLKVTFTSRQLLQWLLAYVDRRETVGGGA